MNIDTTTVLGAMERRQYRVFEGEWNLNLVGVRAAERHADTFNDYFCVLFQCQKRWLLLSFPATTDPGVFYRKNPINPAGSLVLKPGQNLACWALGKHQGKYEALVQRGPMTVYRDNNRDGEINTDGHTETGLFGVNLHRASVRAESFEVGKWSAGCQVVRAPWDYDVIIALARRSALDWGERFSYTLLDESELAS